MAQNILAFLLSSQRSQVRHEMGCFTVLHLKPMPASPYLLSKQAHHCAPNSNALDPNLTQFISLLMASLYGKASHLHTRNPAKQFSTCFWLLFLFIFPLWPSQSLLCTSRVQPTTDTPAPSMLAGSCALTLSLSSLLFSAYYSLFLYFPFPMLYLLKVQLI